MKKIIAVLLLLCFNYFTAQTPNDCVNAITVCSNGSFSSNADGIGNVQEINGFCSGFEHNSVWLKINIVQSGTLGFHLRPNEQDISVDFDFWVFGPNRPCNNLGNPIRCSTTNPQAAGLPNNYTGMHGSTTATQNGPGANGNGYVRWLNVLAGESYYIAIDRPEGILGGDGGFELEWIGSATQGTGAFAPPPTANAIEDYISCSTNANTGIFDLNTVRSSINSDLVANTITFHNTIENAIDGIGALPAILANSTNPQQIFARVRDNVTGCFSVTDFNLVVYPVPDADIAVSSTEICQGEIVTVTITGTPNSTVTYQANGGTNQTALLDASGSFSFDQTLTTDTTFALSLAQIIDTDGSVICSRNLTDAVTVLVNEIQPPAFITNSPICSGESAIITFTGRPNTILNFTINGNPESINIDGTGSYIHTISNVTANLAMVLEDITYDATPFCSLTLNINETILVENVPAIVSPTPYLICNTTGNPNSALFQLDSKNGEITNNNSALTVTYYLTQALADSGDPADTLPNSYPSIAANQTVYVRVESVAGCVSFTELELQVVEAPTANAPTPLNNCENGTTGIATFDLDQTVAEIILGNTFPVAVTFYETLTQAQIGEDEITSANTHNSTTGSVFVRVQSGSCFEIVELVLNVLPNPIINPPGTISECDDDSDGITTFNLDNLVNTILNGLPQTGYSVRFYTDQNDAINQPSNFISPSNHYENTTPFNQIIWIRLENNTTSCFSVQALPLVVNLPLQLPSNASLTVCDVNNDGFAVFNLPSAQNAILMNAVNPSNHQVQFYHTELGAINETASELISSPGSFTNLTSGNSTIGVRVEHILTGCYSTTTLNLNLIPLPDVSAITLSDLVLCDEVTPYDLSETFDLTVYESLIRNGIPNLNITYHHSIGNASSGTNPIGTASNYNSPSATIYIRVVNSLSTNPFCSVVLPLNLVVNPLPSLMLNRIIICDANLSGFADFDLQGKIPEILGSSQPISNFKVEFFEDNLENSPILSNPYTNTTIDLQVIYVKITNLTTLCSVIHPFDLKVEAGAQAMQPDDWEVCDYDGVNDGIATFDLTTLDSIVLNGQNSADFQVTYHLTATGALNGTNAIANPESHQNTLSPNQQTIHIRVKNINFVTSCVATATVLLRVEKLLEPVITTVDGSNTICVNYETGIVERTLTLRSSIQGSNYTYTWFLNGSIIPDATASTYLVNTASPGMYSVLIENPSSGLGCISDRSEDFEVIQSGPAVIIDYQVSAAFTDNATITVQVDGYGTYWFQLNDGPILNNGGVFTNVPTGIHTVTVHDQKTGNPSCGSVVIENIRIIDYPKFFTPNGDGYNDEWNITALRHQPNAYIVIFDRYGKVLKSISPNGAGWDGTFNGKALFSTDYWFIVYYEENGVPREFKSHFALKR